MWSVLRGVVVVAMALGLVFASAQAEDRREKSDRIVGSVLSGLLGAPQGAPDAAYVAQERERLVSLLQGGAYVTSRQGEPVELVVLGVPLTRAEHVYTARPIAPSATSSP